VKLDRNQRQSKAEERVLGRNIVYLGGNAQPKGEGSYGGKGGQIMWRTGEEYRGRRGSILDRKEGQTGPRRDPNTMDIDRSREEDRTCYVCGKWDYMAKNCWERYKGRVVEMPQELAKGNGGQ